MLQSPIWLENGGSTGPDVPLPFLMEPTYILNDFGQISCFNAETGTNIGD